MDLCHRCGAGRHYCLDDAAEAAFYVRLVLDAQVHGALAVLLGRHERLLVLRNALVQDDAVRFYVNNILLSGRAVRRIMAAINPYRYDRHYGAFGGWTPTPESW